MGRQFTILISDRNRNVREFLKREMMGEAYRVRLAKSWREVLGYFFMTIMLGKYKQILRII